MTVPLFPMTGQEIQELLYSDTLKSKGEHHQM